MEERVENNRLIRAGTLLLKIHDRIINAFVHIACWMTFAVTLGVGYEVASRYFFNRPTVWAVDFMDYTMLYMTFLAAAYLAREGGHVNLTYLLDHIHGRRLQVTQAVNNYVCALVSAFIFYYTAGDTWDAVVNGLTVNRALEIPKYYVIGVIPLGMFFVCIQFIRNGFACLAKSRECAQEGTTHTTESL